MRTFRARSWRRRSGTWNRRAPHRISRCAAAASSPAVRACEYRKAWHSSPVRRRRRRIVVTACRPRCCRRGWPTLSAPAATSPSSPPSPVRNRREHATPRFSPALHPRGARQEPIRTARSITAYSERVPRPRKFDESDVVAAARDEFWLRGYAATSVDDLTSVTGLGKGSLYGAFGDKHGLFMLALDDY